MNTWVRICIGLVLLGVGVANVALAMTAGAAMPSETRFKVIFYLVLFVLPGLIELKTGLASFLSAFRRRDCP